MGKPIDGFTEEQATALCGSSARMPVTWGDSGDVSQFAGKPAVDGVQLNDRQEEEYDHQEKAPRKIAPPSAGSRLRLPSPARTENLSGNAIRTRDPPAEQKG